MRQNSHDDLRQMIADHMENGFLENIIDMFRHDKALYDSVAELIQDERIRVRIGITALMEELKLLDPAHISLAQSHLLPLLGHDNAVTRGDAANLLGIIGDKGAISYLEKLLSDENSNVRMIAQEALTEMKQTDS